MSFGDEGDVFHSSSSFSTWMDPHPSLRHILLFSGAFGGSRFPQRGTILHLKIIFIFIMPWGHTLGVS